MMLRMRSYPILSLDLGGGKYQNENSQILLAESETKGSGSLFTIHTFKISSKQSLQICVPHQP